MVLSGKTLFIAGPRDVLDETTAQKHASKNAEQLRRQEAAWNGTGDAALFSVSIEDGSVAARLPLDAAPAWDGMVAADGRLFLSLRDGTLRCYAPK
jgi:hypothetical protein